MKNLFIIEHSITRNDDGSILLELFKVYLNRNKTRKTYTIHHYQQEGFIKVDKEKHISHDVKDLLTLRYLNLIYLKRQTVQVSQELVDEMIRQHEKLE